MTRDSRSLLRTFVTWLRIVLPPSWALVCFAVGLAGLELFAHSILGGPKYWEDTREFVLLTHAPRTSWLACGLVLYGAFRVLAKHPLFRPAYAEWLAATPWRGQLALPLGPAHLMPQDGLILLLAWLVALHDSPFGFHGVVALLMLPYLFGLIVALLMGGATAHAYCLAYGLALAVWLGLPSLGATLVLIPLYCVGWHGLSISLRRLALNKSSRLREAFRTLAVFEPAPSSIARKITGFPLTQIGPRADYPAVSLGESLLIAWLIAAWAYALLSRAPDSGDRIEAGYTMALAGVSLAWLARVKIYCSEYRPPITLAGRLSTSRWFIPGYDRVWLPMVCAVGVIATLTFLLFEGVRRFELAPLALGLGWSILLGMPPRLSDWALTGQHRIVADPFARSEFIEV